MVGLITNSRTSALYKGGGLWYSTLMNIIDAIGFLLWSYAKWTRHIWEDIT